MIYILFSFFILNLLLIKILFNKSNYLKLISTPNNRSSDKKPVSTVPGLIIFITFIVTSFYSFNGILNVFEYIIFITSTTIVYMIGLFDDYIKVSTFKKICFQLILSLIVLFGINLENVLIFPFVSNFYINLFFQVFFILGIANSINLIDGIDNLSATISIVVSASIIYFFKFLGFTNIVFVFMIFSLLAYLFFNIFINRVFIGNSGSLLLGWIFAIISLILMKISNSITFPIIILIIAIPAFDVLYVMFYRFFFKNNKSILERFEYIFIPDFLHIHHSLIALSLKNNTICFILGFLSILFSIISFLMLIFDFTFFDQLLIVSVFILIYFLFRFVLDKNRINS